MWIISFLKILDRLCGLLYKPCELKIEITPLDKHDAKMGVSDTIRIYIGHAVIRLVYYIYLGYLLVFVCFYNYESLKIVYTNIQS